MSVKYKVRNTYHLTNMEANIFLGIVSLLHVIYAWRTQLKINETTSFNSFQKRFNSVLIWVIPFFWSLITRSIIREPKIQVMTKSHRKRGSSGDNSDNWMGLTGGGDMDSGGGGSDGGGGGD